MCGEALERSEERCIGVEGERIVEDEGGEGEGEGGIDSGGMLGENKADTFDVKRLWRSRSIVRTKTST